MCSSLWRRPNLNKIQISTIVQSAERSDNDLLRMNFIICMKVEFINQSQVLWKDHLQKRVTAIWLVKSKLSRNMTQCVVIRSLCHLHIVEICILIRLEDDPAPIYTEASVIRVPACMTANNINIWPTAFYIYCMVNKKDEESQINGILMIMDLKSVGWKHVKNISPLYSKRIMSLLQVRSSLGI